jgi:hypothetical protein
MKRAALGIQMHSGWGVVVAVSGAIKSVEILDRRRIVTADPAIAGAKQPYHHASHLELSEAERYLASCTATSSRMASMAIEEVVRELDGRGHRIVGASVLLASGRPLPPVAKILASHPLIHTAEGEFFRHAARRGCEDLKIPVTAIRERELDEQAEAAFGSEASPLRAGIARLGSSIGPPWTKDHKTAALAAALILTHAQ